jgi:alanine dehydrogenase
MPGACARTLIGALTNATMTYILRIANFGYRKALFEAPHLLSGLNVYQGKITNRGVADVQSRKYFELEKVLL